MAKTAWYQNLALLKPTQYRPWRHALRITIGTGLPLLVGVLSGDVAATIFVALGAFLTAFTVRLDPYRERFLQIAVSSSIGVLGCLLGPMVAGHGVMTSVVLVLVALFSGLISGYGAAFSTGALNMLVLTIVTSGMAHVADSWVLALQYLTGVLLVVVLIAIFAAFDRNRPERQILVGLLRAVVDLARAEGVAVANPQVAHGFDVDIKRRAVTDASKLAYDVLIEKRSHGRSRTRYTVHTAATLSLINQLTMTIIAARASSQTLLAVASRLEIVANAYDVDGVRPGLDESSDEGQDELLALVERLSTEMWSPSEWTRERKSAKGESATPVFSAKPLRTVLRRFIVGREVIISALRLALCMGIAVLVSQYIPGSHYYWLLLTVAIVLKPDFGSVFVRGIHRCIGTLVGVGISGVVAAFVHNDLGTLAVIVLLCAFIPWAGLRSYAATVAFMTPVILLMLSLIAPDAIDSYALQRIIDTLLGAAICLIFGYLIWPRSQGSQISATFAGALQTVKSFLTVVTGPVPEEAEALTAFRQTMVDREFAAYRSLSDLRTQLQRLVAEPPPAGREAASWFPAVAGAERLCDRITAYGEGRRLGDPPPDAARAARAIKSIEAIATGQRPELITDTVDVGDLFAQVEAEVLWLSDYLDQLNNDASVKPHDATPVSRAS